MKNVSRKITLALLLLVSTLILVACGVKGPENVAENFLESYKSLDVEEMKKYVSKDVEESLREDLSNEAEDSEDVEDLFTEELKGSIGRYVSELEYEIIDINKNEENTKVDLNISFIYADGSKVISSSMGEIFGELMGLAFSGEEATDEEVNNVLSKVLVRNLDENEITKENVSGVISLEKEEDKWLITEMDDNVLNVLSIGLINGLENWNPLGNLESEDGEFGINEEFELDFGDIEISEELKDEEN